MKADYIRIFGSCLYGTAHENSDTDLFMIYRNAKIEEFDENNDAYSIQRMRLSTYQQRLSDHDIAAMEVFFSEPVPGTYFELDYDKLRRSISAVVSNSWVKAKKKMLQGDDYVGRKSMWHSIRILRFGIQIAKTGRIENFQESNDLYDIIMNEGHPYDVLKGMFHPMMKAWQTEFRILAPKVD